jgi:hypothetical protein
MKILQIKEQKDGNAILEFSLSKEDEIALKQVAKIRGVRYSKKFATERILEGIESYITSKERRKHIRIGSKS